MGLIDCIFTILSDIYMELFWGAFLIKLQSDTPTLLGSLRHGGLEGVFESLLNW